MAPKYSLLLSVLVSHLLLMLLMAVTSANTEDGNMGANIPLTLEYVGLIDGKIYFKDRGSYEDWTGAGDYCRKANLRLATIESRGRADLLKRHLNETGDVNAFWIDARESRLPSMLVWNSTEVGLDDSLAELWDFGTDYYNCGRIDVSRSSDYRFRITAWRCDVKIRVLCEGFAS